MSRASLRRSGKPDNLPDPTERAIAIPGLRSVRCTRRSVNRARSHVSHPEDSRPQSVAYRQHLRCVQIRPSLAEARAKLPAPKRLRVKPQQHPRSWTCSAIPT